MRIRSLLVFAALGAFAVSSMAACDAPMYFQPKGGGGQAGGGGTGGTGGVLLCSPGETRECYTGPDGTKGQGICKVGLETCNGDGTAFSPCEGETHPGQEDCATPLDEDCDGLAPSCEGLCLWSKAFGDPETQLARVVTVDPAGALIVAGPFSGALDLGGGPLDSPDGTGTFIGKLDALDAAHVWSQSFSGGVQSFTAIAVDNAGNVTVTGSFIGMVDFGGGPVDGAAGSTFVVQFAASGELRWSRTFKGGLQTPQSVVSDVDGNVLVAGSFLGSTDFGAGMVSAQAGGGDAFLVKLSAIDGAYQWAKTFGDGATQSAARILVDPADGNIVVAGIFDGSIDFGAGPLSNDQPGPDIFLSKLTALDGSPVWSKQLRGDNSQAVFDMISDTTGNLILAGTFFGTADLGGGTATSSAGGADIFVTKLALADGAFIWRKTFGQEGDQTVRAATTDGMGNIVLAGPLSDETDFGGGPLPGTGLDVYVVKLSGLDGKHVWSKRFGDDDDQAAFDVGADAAGNVFLTGFFKSAINFGCGKLTSSGDMDVFVAKLSP